MSSLSGNALLHQFAQGDKEVIKMLYEKVFPKVISYVGKNNGNYDDAQEIFQKALFEIIVRHKTKGIDIKSTFEGYIFTVCRNLWMKELNSRKRQVRNDTYIELKVDEDNTIASIIDQERWDLFEEKLKLLSDNCRALLKDFFDKVPYKLIVKKFNYSCENVAFQRVFKCKKRLGDLIRTDTRYKDLF